MVDATTLISSITGRVIENRLTTFEITLIRSTMLRMRPFVCFPDFAVMFRNPQHAEHMYRCLQEYTTLYRAASPDAQVKLDAAVKTALNEVRK